MRQTITVFSVLAVVALAAGAAQAGYTLPFNAGGVPTNGADNDIFAQTFNNGPLENYDGNYASAANWSNPNSTVDGAVWINTGSGPVMLTTTVNADLWVNDPVASWGSGGNGSGYCANGWVEEALLLNSDGSSARDFSAASPGIFNGPAIELSVPGTGWYWYFNHPGGQKTSPNTTFQMDLFLWTGTETTYAAALAAGDYTAEATWSETGFTSADFGIIQPPPIPGDLDNPAMILENLSGDANGDGRVDINDLTIVLANYGMSGTILDVTRADGDLNGDGKVDINDLTIVLADYGATLGSSAAGMAAVPEPSALALIVAGLAGWLACAWRKRQ